MASALAELNDIRDRLAATEGVIEDRLALERIGADGLADLTGSVDRAAHQLAQLEQPWLAAVRSELRTAVFAATWRDQVKACREGIEELAAWQGRLLGHSVVLPTEACRRRSLSSSSRNSATDWLPGKACPKPSKKTCTGSERSAGWMKSRRTAPKNTELCILEARSRRRRYELIRRWNGAVGRVGGPLLDPTTSHPEYLLNQYLQGIDAALAWEDRTWYALCDRLQACGIRAPRQATSTSLAALAGTLRTVALHVRGEGPDRVAESRPPASRQRRRPATGQRVLGTAARRLYSLGLGHLGTDHWDRSAHPSPDRGRRAACDLTRRPRRCGPSVDQPDRRITW